MSFKSVAAWRYVTQIKMKRPKKPRTLQMATKSYLTLFSSLQATCIYHNLFHCESDPQRWVIEGGGIITLSSTIVYQYWTGHNNYNTGWSTTGAQQLLYRVITTGPTCHYLINIVIIIKTMLIYFLVCSTLLCLVHYDWNLYGQLWMRHWDLQMKQSEVSLYGITNMINIFIFLLS